MYGSFPTCPVATSTRSGCRARLRWTGRRQHGRKGKKHLVSASSCVHVFLMRRRSSSHRGGGNVRTSAGATHDQSARFSSPFYAQVRTRTSWPNAPPRAVWRVYEARSERARCFRALKASRVVVPLYRRRCSRIPKPS